MKKLFYMSMTMQPVLEAAYKIEGKEKLIYYPTTVKFSEEIKKDDDVTIIIVKMTDEDDPKEFEERFNRNYKVFYDEIESVNQEIGAKVTYKIIESNFVETKDAFGKRFMEMFDELEENCKIYADVTWGTKTTALLFMNILNFAEKFYDADIDSVIYGKTVMLKGEDGRNHPCVEKSKVCDVTILYLFNNLTTAMNADSGEEAKEILKLFFGI